MKTVYEHALVDWRPYHNNAQLYGVEKRDISTLKAALYEIAPFMMGFIKTLNPNNTITKNKTIEKLCEGSEMMVTKFAELVKHDYQQ